MPGMQVVDGYFVKYGASCVALLVYALPIYLRDPRLRGSQDDITQDYVRAMRLLQNTSRCRLGPRACHVQLVPGLSIFPHYRMTRWQQGSKAMAHLLQNRCHLGHSAHGEGQGLQNSNRCCLGCKAPQVRLAPAPAIFGHMMTDRRLSLHREAEAAALTLLGSHSLWRNHALHLSDGAKAILWSSSVSKQWPPTTAAGLAGAPSPHLLGDVNEAGRLDHGHGMPCQEQSSTTAAWACREAVHASRGPGA